MRNKVIPFSELTQISKLFVSENSIEVKVLLYRFNIAIRTRMFSYLNPQTI